MFKRGHKPEARKVAKQLGISKLQLMSARNRIRLGRGDRRGVVGEDNAAAAG